MSHEHWLDLNYYTAPKIVPSETPKMIRVDGREAIECVSEDELNNYLENFYNYISGPWRDFQALFINDAGGKQFAEDLLSNLGFIPTFHIEVHEDKSVVKAIPQFYIDRPWIPTVTVDDIFDLGITGNIIKCQAPSTKLLYFSKKYDVLNQKAVEGATHVIEIPDRWALGYGMNGDIPGDGYPKNWGRTYRGIAFKNLKPI